MSRLRVTMIRCSTLLLEWPNFRILTDPWFGMQMRGLPCFRWPGLPADELPPLNLVLVSNLRPDHWDGRAIREFSAPPERFIFPAGSLERLGRGAPQCAHELRPWTAQWFGDVRVAAVPGPHDGQAPADVSYVIDYPDWGRLFFGGDGHFDYDVLARVGREWGPFRVALLPVGGTLIFGHRTVMSPSDAARATDLLDAERVVPIHEGGIWMSVPPASLHPGRMRHLVNAFAEAGRADRVVALAEGESAEL